MSKLILDEQVKMLSRRGFLTRAVAMAAGGAAAVALVPQAAFAEEPTPGAAVNEDGEKVRVFDGMGLSQGRIMHDPDLCAGCRICEIVCSLNKWGVMNEEWSAIRIRTDFLGGYISQAEVCKQCAGAECVAVCPNNANYIDPTTGARVIDGTLCVGCQLCLNACPVTPSRIHYNPNANVCVKCDFCGGEPKCVEYCPTHAVTASWVESAGSSSVIETESGIVINLAVTGAIISIARDTITVSNVNAMIANGVVVTGDIASTYSQPFTAKIKASYFNAANEPLYVSERLELHVDAGGATSFEDAYETAAPEEVKSINLEIMCGKIAG